MRALSNHKGTGERGDRREGWRVRAAMLATLALAGLAPAIGQAATFNVSTTAGLLNAVQSANAMPGTDVIVLAPGVYRPDFGLDISDDVTINGGGAPGSVIEPPPGSSGDLLRIRSCVGPVQVEINDLTVRNGSTGLLIRCGASVRVNRSTFAGHATYGVEHRAPASTVLEITNSTLSGNFGGLFSEHSSPAAITLRHLTVTGNTSFGISADPPVPMTASIVAGNGVVDCFLPLPGTGNVDSDGSCGGTTVADAMLGPLADNGGPTATHAPLPGSPVVDAGGATCPATDQRGIARPADGDSDGTASCDVGAVEIAAVIFVDTVADTTTCTSGACSLRGAVILANARPGADTIVLPAGVYALTREGSGEDDADTGDLDLTDHLVIVGAAQGLAVVEAAFAADPDRVFQVRSGVHASLSGLTIRNGSSTAGSVTARAGGGVRNDGTTTLREVTVSGNVSDSFGGGLHNTGDLTLLACTVEGNTALFEGGGMHNYGGDLTLRDSTVRNNLSRGTQSGGGIASGGGATFAGGTLTLQNVTVSGNTSEHGGGIKSSSTATLTNVTVSGNVATGGAGGPPVAGGIWHAAGAMTLAHVTITGNSADASGALGGGGLVVGGFGPTATAAVRNTIIAGNAGGNCLAQPQGTLGSAGGNLDDDGTCPFTSPLDLPSADPNLGPLADNGGPTRTHALLAGSPAIDAATGCPPPANDQRGNARPEDGDGDGTAACDSGAYEASRTSGSATATTLVSSGTPTLFGEPVTLSAMVALLPPATGTPTGTVVFKDGATTVGAATLDAAGMAAFTTSALGLGSHSITALYAGDVGFLPSSSNALAHVVDPGTTSAVLVASPSPSTVGQTVTLTATVSAVAPASGTPIGSVTLTEGPTFVALAALSGGSATFLLSNLAVGTHTLTATYNGSPELSAGTPGTTTHTVNRSAVQVEIQTTPRPSSPCTPVTVSISVRPLPPATGTPTGTVTLMEGSTTLATGQLIPGFGSALAVFVLPPLAAGTHVLTAIFDGDGAFDASTSAPFAHPVTSDPANDDLSGAQPIDGTLGSVCGTLLNATTEPLEPNHGSAGCIAGPESVWYRYQVPSGYDGLLRLSVPSGDACLAVYTQQAFGPSFPRLAAGGPGPLTLPVSRGMALSIAVASHVPSPPSSFTLAWSFNFAPANNDIAAAEMIGGTHGTITGFLAGAAGEFGEPNHSSPTCTAGPESVWYVLDPPGDPTGGVGFVTLSVSAGDPCLAAYRPVTGGFGVERIAGGGPPELSFVAPLDDAVYIAVAARSGSTASSFRINWVLALPETTQGDVAAAETLSTDDDADGATPPDPVETWVTTPAGGPISISEAVVQDPHTAFSFLGWAIEISAPVATPTSPLVIRFELDASLLPPDPLQVQVFRNGGQVPPCTGPAGVASPDPCVFERVILPDGDLRLAVYTSRASRWSFGLPLATSGGAVGLLLPRSGGYAAFAGTKAGGQLVGGLTFLKGRERFVAVRLSAFAVSADGHSAWLAGVGLDGRTFLAYAEDHGHAGDLFRLWISGVERTGDGTVALGDIVVAP